MLLRCVVLTAFISWQFSSADVIRIPLKKVRDPLLQGTVKAVIDSSDLNAESTFPLVNLTKNTFQYFGEISVGTPGQKIKVAFGTAWDNILIPSLTSSISCTGNHSVFNETASSTFIKNGNIIQGQPPYKTFQPALETIDIDSISVKNQSVGLILEGDCNGLVYDGIVGLGFSESSLISNMFKTKLISEFVVGLRIDKDPNSTNGGEINIGGVNKDLIESSNIPYITSAPNTSKWKITVQSVNLGSTAFDTDFVATLDSSVSFIGFPKKFLNQVQNITQGIPLNDSLFIDQTTIKHLPPLTFIIDDRNYTISGQDYVDTFHQYKTLSYMLLKPTDTDEWILGNAFLGNYYTILNYETKKVAFARFQHKTNGASTVKFYWMTAPLAILIYILN